MGIEQMRMWRARVRTLVEGLLQTGRAEVHERHARDEVERWQDYGFTSAPVDGQGLLLEVDGHSILVRVDRLTDRPHLADYEVSVWHREGHHVTLRSEGRVEVSCARLVVQASEAVEITSPQITLNASDQVAVSAPQVSVEGEVSVTGDVATTGSLTNNGSNVGSSHTHPFTDDVLGSSAPDNTGPPG